MSNSIRIIEKKSFFKTGDFDTFIYERANSPRFFSKSIIYYRGILVQVFLNRDNHFDNNVGYRARDFISKLCKVPIDSVYFNNNANCSHLLKLTIVYDYAERL